MILPEKFQPWTSLKEDFPLTGLVMLRALIFLLLAPLLFACIAEEDEEDIVNDQGDTVADPTLRLNGLWDGQLDQAGSIRVLIFNGNVLAFDATTGFYGTVTLDEDSATATMNLSGYSYSSSDTEANQLIASGSAEDYSMSGLLFPTSTEDDTLIGDYESDIAPGGFEFNNDGTWTRSSSLAAIKGKWVSSGYELFLSEVGEEISFREVQISTPATGCTSRGTIKLINEEEVLYSLQLTERKNCTGFNVNNAPGYATVNANGQLELFMRKGGDLMYALYDREVAEDPAADDAAADGDEPATDETEEVVAE